MPENRPGHQHAADVVHGADYHFARVIRVGYYAPKGSHYALQVRQEHLHKWATVMIFTYFFLARACCDRVEVAFKEPKIERKGSHGAQLDTQERLQAG